MRRRSRLRVDVGQRAASRSRGSGSAGAGRGLATRGGCLPPAAATVDLPESATAFKLILCHPNKIPAAPTEKVASPELDPKMAILVRFSGAEFLMPLCPTFRASTTEVAPGRSALRNLGLVFRPTCLTFTWEGLVMPIRHDLHSSPATPHTNAVPADDGAHETNRASSKLRRHVKPFPRCEGGLGGETLERPCGLACRAE